MYARLLSFIWLALFQNIVTAQSLKRTNVWYFGRNAGLDFNTSPPTPLSNGALNTWEGCATLSDENGQLLMYTDGSTIWNKNHFPMPNATDLGGNSSSSQSGIIVPKPSSTNGYYVVSVDYEGGSGGVQYSEVNMSANGGLGGITRKNVRLLPRAVEKLTTVPHCNGKHYWVLAHETGNNKFYAWLLTENGIDASHPVVSAVGSVHGSSSRSTIGYMRSSPEGNRVALAIQGQDTFELFDFDKKTGRLSNSISLSDSRFRYAYGVEFSPNGRFLYLAGAQTKAIVYQIELVAGRAPELMRTLTVVGQSARNDFGALQTASDGKIYIAQDGNNKLSVIANPNQKGLACNFQEDAVRLSANSSFGLPNLIPSLFARTISAQIRQAPTTCGFVNLNVTTNDMGPIAYQWYHDGRLIPGATSASYAAKESGTFQVEVAQNKECDTLRTATAVSVVVTGQQVVKPIISHSGSLTICQGNNSVLRITTLNELRYDWYKNNEKLLTEPGQVEVTEAGTYRVKAYNDCDSLYSDAITVSVTSKLEDPLGRDTSFCEGRYVLISPGNSIGSITWADGSTAIERKIDQPGIYAARVTSGGCTADDTVRVRSRPTYAFSLGNDSSFCTGDRVVLSAPQNRPTQVQLKWSNDSQADTIIVKQAGFVWLEATLNGCSYRDSIWVESKTCSETLAFVPDAFTPNGDGINDRFIPKLSLNALVTDYTFTIYSRWGSVLYSTATPEMGWDGNYEGVPCIDALYTYRIRFTYNHNNTLKSYDQQGSVLLVR